MKSQTLLSIILGSLFFYLSGCSQSQPSDSYRAPIYNQSDVVTFENIQYQISDVFWAKQIGPAYLRKKPNADFLIIYLSITNKTQKPVERVFSPIFMLEDSTSTEYEPTTSVYLRQGLQLKMMTEPINPNVTLRGYLVFDVPESARYKLRILSPFYAREAISNSIKVVGFYFYIALLPNGTIETFEEH